MVRWFQTDGFWILLTLTLVILALTSHIMVQFTGGYSPGLYWDMIPHFLSGAAICAFFLNFNLSRTKQKLLPIIPLILLIVLPAIMYTLALGLTWEIIEESIEYFLPWVGIYADFWWNGVRDLFMVLLGALFVTFIYLKHVPRIIHQIPEQPKTMPQKPLPGVTPMRSFCDNCGTTIPPDAKHCPNCGHQV